MEPSDLDLYTTQELITELLRRKTFLGVVVHSEQELRTGSWPAEGLFKVHYSPSLAAGEAGRLLGVVAQYVEQQDA